MKSAFLDREHVVPGQQCLSYFRDQMRSWNVAAFYLYFRTQLVYPLQLSVSLNLYSVHVSSATCTVILTVCKYHITKCVYQVFDLKWVAVTKKLLPDVVNIETQHELHLLFWICCQSHSIMETIQCINIIISLPLAWYSDCVNVKYHKSHYKHRYHLH